MSSDIQIQANQQNAQKSTGPITPEGKAASAMNAVTHGLRARHAVIKGESQEEFDQLQTAVHTELKPVGDVENNYAERMVVSRWKLARLDRMEAERAAEGECDSLHILWAQQARLERAYDKALATLKQLQKARVQTEQPKPKPVQTETKPQPQQQQPQQPQPQNPKPPVLDMRRNLANNVPGIRQIPGYPKGH